MNNGCLRLLLNWDIIATIKLKWRVKMTRVYLVRHAQAVANVTGYCYGISECDVTDEGKEQLLKLAERFRDIPIDIIYSSPMKRTLATAKAVNQYHDVPVIQEPRCY